MAAALEAFEDWVAALGAVGFTLVVLFLWGILWMWSSIRGATRLGPVEVTLLDVDLEDKKAERHALTALLREGLAASGLMPPPEVPAGSPQTNLLAAVESSGHPQAPWVAKALSLIPQPPRSPQYKLSGTLLGGVDDAGTPSACGLRYWLQPRETGRPRLETVMSKTSHEDAVTKAAADIFLAISRDAVHVFPPWSQWQKRDALLLYLEGIHASSGDPGQDELARTHFEAAADASRTNLLPKLRLANLMEKGASDGSIAPAPGESLPVLRARVLRKYLDIGVAQPDLVSARYRAGVVAALLASDCQSINDADRAQVRKEVRLQEAPGQTLSKALHECAESEARSAYHLVCRFHVLLYEHRLRHRYEPSGLERRRLRRTIAISRCCLEIRKLGTEDNLRAKRKIAWNRARVQLWHLGLLRAGAGWNAHYSAGCFYALLYERNMALEALRNG